MLICNKRGKSDEDNMMRLKMLEGMCRVQSPAWSGFLRLCLTELPALGDKWGEI